jgi:hypothetical protein
MMSFAATVAIVVRTPSPFVVVGVKTLRDTGLVGESVRARRQGI